MLTARPYQVASVRGVFDRLCTHDEPSTLVVLPTGCGKTVVFGLVALEWWKSRPGRVLVLAHRDELISQAADELAGIMGVRPAVEQAEKFAWPAAGSVDAPPVVVGSVQTLCSPKRLARWPKDEFGLIVTDEAHHATSNSYRRIYEHFAGAKLLGVTATPKRADDLALGSVFGSVAYSMGIEDAVDGGWLCPVEQRFVTVHGLNLAAVRTEGDDFKKSDLSAVLSGDTVLDQMVAATIELCGEEPTLVFTAPKQPGGDVSQGEMYADALNKVKPGRAVFLSGETPVDIRRRELEWFEQGKRQYLVGCSLFTEGFNVPKISRVVMARLTKSVVYYTQAIGRGTRTLRGVLRPEHDTPDQRRAAIAASTKPSVVVIDFVGNSGRHKLVSAVDIFAGKHPDAVIERAKKLAEKKQRPVRELLDEAAEQERRQRQRQEAERQRREEERKARVRVQSVQLQQRDVNPFGGSDGAIVVARPVRPGGATKTQLDWIRNNGGVVGDDATAGEAGRIIDDIKRRRSAGHCSPKQERTLKRAGLADGPIPKEHAKALVDWLSQTGWVKRSRPNRSQLAIVPVQNGFRLAIAGVAVGGVYASPAQVRKVYDGLAAAQVAVA